MEEKCEEIMETKGMGWRVSLSILVGVGWLVFLLIWLFFYAEAYNWEKNVAIFLLSLLVLVLIAGTPWIIWKRKHLEDAEKEMWKTKGFKSRVIVSGIAVFAVFIFLIYWFWYLAGPYSMLKNIVIFIVPFLIVGGILGAMWAPWGMKHGRRFEKK
jgi:amino acid transporter